MQGKYQVKKQFADYFIDERRYERSTLKRIDGSINWGKIDYRFKGLKGTELGRTSYAPLMMFKILLLEQWYNLSDPEAEEQIADRTSFKRFLGLSVQDEPPDETTICRFRNSLIESGLAGKIFQIINEQLAAKGILLRTGTIVDATIVQSGSKRDVEASWTRKNDESRHGYKLHAAVSVDKGLIQGLGVTTARVHDTNVLESIIPGETREVYADRAYDSEERRENFIRRGVACRILYRRTCKERRLGLAKYMRNMSWGKVRQGVERTFAHLKRVYGYRQVRYFGLKKNLSHAYILASAYNLKRAVAYAYA
jgi:IS5 family transposase